ncbi:MAG: signal peptide peptidase SppA [Methanomicrobia archaeon]|nr:signal peptide peptidase SppA [Methanomicrobia archaeon]
MENKRKVIALLLIGLCLISTVIGIAIVANFDSGGIGGDKIAIISIEGAIVGGSGGGFGIFGSESGADDIAKLIKRAGEDPSVRAIILRINSPGGSAAASQELHAEVCKAQENGKIVVTSMSDVATSGGYYVACASDKIVANPGTITGSIGVIFSQLQYSELLEEYGIRANVIKSGKYKDIGSPLRNMTEEERELLQEMIDDIYFQFVRAVAEGRQMNESEVLELADGRILTGRQAKEMGLVDELGNFQDAVDLAAELAGIEGEPRVVEYGRKSAFESFFGVFARELGHGIAETILEAGKPRGGVGGGMSQLFIFLSSLFFKI